jgi:hypothetical protein
MATMVRPIRVVSLHRPFYFSTGTGRINKICGRPGRNLPAPLGIGSQLPDRRIGICSKRERSGTKQGILSGLRTRILPPVIAARPSVVSGSGGKPITCPAEGRVRCNDPWPRAEAPPATSTKKRYTIPFIALFWNRMPGTASLHNPERAFYRIFLNALISPFVEESWDLTSSLFCSSGRIFPASCLPSSTPH